MDINRFRSLARCLTAASSRRAALGALLGMLVPAAAPRAAPRRQPPRLKGNVVTYDLDFVGCEPNPPPYAGIGCAYLPPVDGNYYLRHFDITPDPNGRFLVQIELPPRRCPVEFLIAPLRPDGVGGPSKVVRLQPGHRSQPFDVGVAKVIEITPYGVAVRGDRRCRTRVLRSVQATIRVARLPD